MKSDFSQLSDAARDVGVRLGAFFEQAKIHDGGSDCESGEREDIGSGDLFDGKRFWDVAKVPCLRVGTFPFAGQAVPGRGTMIDGFETLLDFGEVATGGYSSLLAVDDLDAGGEVEGQGGIGPRVWTDRDPEGLGDEVREGAKEIGPT